MKRLHASCVVFGDHGVLLRGPSGCGKSDLALRLIDAGATLLSDDYVELSAEQGRIVARPPPAIKGLIEVRGLGILRLPFCDQASIRLVVDLTETANIDRLPAKRHIDLEDFPGLSMRYILVSPFEASASAKITLAATIKDQDMVEDA